MTRGRLPDTSSASGNTGQDSKDCDDLWNSDCPSSGLQSSNTSPGSTKNAVSNKSDGSNSVQNTDGWGPPSGNDGLGQPAANDGWGPPAANDGWGPPAANDGWGPADKGDFLDSTNQENGHDALGVDAVGPCIYCQGPHRSSECNRSTGNGYSASGGERRSDDRTCNSCNRTGHIARNCRQNSGSSHTSPGSVVRCSNCGGRGHSEALCPSEPFNNQNNGWGNSSSRTDRGGDSNYSSSQPEASDQVCYRCNESGHRAHQCPKRVGADREPESTGPYSHIVEMTEAQALNRNNTGINFDRYDQIQVKVSNSVGVETSEYESKKLQTFEDGNLHEDLLVMIRKLGFEKPTPVQRYSLPILDDGKDLMACAQTGSGKTAAFILPLVNTLIREGLTGRTAGRPQKPYALILTPTRELTVQITEDAKAYCCRTSIQVKECYGGTAIGVQARNIQSGCHVLVGTTGRVMDFLNREFISLGNLRYLVLDEADRMLDMGFSQNVKEILGHPSRARNSPVQTLMFSATFPKDVQELARDYLKSDFMKLDVGVVGAVNEDVTQCVEQISGQGPKKKRLLKIIQEELMKRRDAKILVFVDQKKNADTIALFLSEMKLKATSMHGDRYQEQREQALHDFQKGDCPVLVATSVAARGLDITGVTHVVNFDLPREIDEYVHRVGRTGRVGNKGQATSFYDPERDSGMKSQLKQSLVDGGQTPPDFLQDQPY